MGDFRALESLWFNNHMQEEQPTFKVTDRRLFNADGSPRELTPEEEAAAAAPAAVASPPPDPGPETPKAATEPSPSPGADEEEFSEADLADARDPTSFVSFLMSIATNAASALGMMEHPVTHQREVDVEAALVTPVGNCQANSADVDRHVDDEVRVLAAALDLRSLERQREIADVLRVVHR